ncbi:MAG: hypothetical protein K8953_10640 [Proteobacteria bacterium]|nr:hypothetical protein [Pseudomonadota bacterium]
MAIKIRIETGNACTDYCENDKVEIKHNDSPPQYFRITHGETTKYDGCVLTLTEVENPDTE